MAASIEFPIIKYYLISIVLLLSLCVQGGVSTSPSKNEVDEDFEIEKQLRTLNKPPIKTIHTEWGDILDCIDINKQPALDHPLLKDHKVKMKPSSSLQNGVKSKSPSITQSDYPIFKIPRERCPKGTVPIRRTSKEDLTRAKSQSTRFGESKDKFPPEKIVGLIYNIPGETYHGVAARVNVYNVSLTSNDQYSSSIIAIENGSDNQVNGIRVGWTVNPQLFGDTLTRIFGVWTADSYLKTGCYNSLCSGFVQVDQDVTLGSPVIHTSVYKGTQFDIPFQLFKDLKSGDWWLVIFHEPGKEVNVGYWPKDLFTNLNRGGIYWGGNVAPSANGDYPPMGNGQIPHDSVDPLACYYRHIQYVDSNNTLLNPKEKHVVQVAECREHYNLKYYGFQKTGDLWHTFQFGGPGGKCLVHQ